MDWKKEVFFIGALIVTGALINWAGAQGIAEILPNSNVECFLPISCEGTPKKKMGEGKEGERDDQ